MWWFLLAINMAGSVILEETVRHVHEGLSWLIRVGRFTLNVGSTIIHQSWGKLVECKHSLLSASWLCLFGEPTTTSSSCKHVFSTWQTVSLNPEAQSTFPYWSCFCLVTIIKSSGKHTKTFDLFLIYFQGIFSPRETNTCPLKDLSAITHRKSI